MFENIEQARSEIFSYIEDYYNRIRLHSSLGYKSPPMFSFAPEIRRAIYTTNTIESLNMTLRKVIKNRAMFPSDEAVFKILYLALRNISKRWTMPIADWSGAMNQFAIIFEDRPPSSGFQNSSFTQII